MAVKKIVFMSSPPISDTNRTSGCCRSTQAATATTSWMSLPPTSGAMKPAPEPVKKTRSVPTVRPASVSIRLEELDDLLGLAGVVPLIVLPGDLAVVRRRPP